MNLYEIINEHLFLYDQNLTTQIHNSLFLFVTTHNWVSKKFFFHYTYTTYVNEWLNEP